MKNLFTLSDGELSVNQVNILHDIPDNVAFSSFSSLCQASSAPPSLYQRVKSQSHKGGFLGFTKAEASERLTNSFGKFNGRKFLSIFRFKSWWSTMWVGNSSSDLQMETQWILLDVPELSSYVLILPIIEGKFRSAIHPGSDGHIMISAESGSSKVRASSFNTIAYVHVSDSPYTLMKEAYCSVRVHLNTFRLLEEKTLPSIIDKFGWCTWDAFHFTVEPVGVWHGVKDFAEGGVPLRFLIIDDGWQRTKFDDGNRVRDGRNTVLGRAEGVATRLSMFQEHDKFRKYKGGTLLGPNAPSYDAKMADVLKAKALELEQVQTACEKAMQSDIINLSDFDSRIEELKKELSSIEEVDASTVDNERCNNSCYNSENVGLKDFIKDLRKRFTGLDDVYVWQALFGAWGGVSPDSIHLSFDSTIVSARVSPGLAGTMFDGALAKCLKYGVGLVRPDQVAEFYNSMHSYLASAGVTGVKVDVIHIIEFFGEAYGGRVELAKAYYEGLSGSLQKNFKGNGLISSMQHCNDFFFLGTWQISLGRVGDDFWFRDPNGDPTGVYWLQGVHMIHCAYNSMWMGQTVQPDWDMFKSDHACAEFHAGSRAICGGPIYVSDSVGCHNFDLIKKLVFPDGTIPRCQHFALPTRDCLFKNPLSDGETILKIWNINKYGGVVGTFNCQGAGWDPKERRIRGYPECYKPASGTVHACDIEWQQKKEAKDMGKAEEYAVYLSQEQELLLMNPNSDAIEVTIQPSSFEIFSFVPITELGYGIKFAAIGLANMLNCGGTVHEIIEHGGNQDGELVTVKVKGAGKLLVYSSQKPKMVLLNGADKKFEWGSNGELTLDLAWEEGNGGVSDLAFAY
ncbi:stachyose synthase-like [Typha latifolia]|uniref:stachyose synthase-like n=1 Tax=Typha latifolia TaxID=4733 RepID=UPI003C30D6C7